MAEKDTQQIEIPQPNIQMVNLRLVGITPYLSNAYPGWLLEDMERDRAKKAKSSKVPTPDEEFEASIHRDEAGRPSMPAAAVHKSMVSAGQRFGGNKKLYGTELRGWFSVLAEWLPIEESQPKMHRTLARTKGRNRAPKPTYRAVYPLPWSVVVPFSYNADFISLEQLVNLAILAGDGVGVGDWRKELSGGTGAYGMFTVEATE